MPDIASDLQEEIARGQSPAVQYFIFDKDQILEKYSSGMADIAGKKVVSDQTTFNAYSVTKIFTSVAILQLAERRIVDIDLLVRKYLPEFPYPSQINIRQLLSHTAGIPNPMPLNWIHPADDKNFDRNDFFAGIFAKHSKIKSKPNEKFAYSNLGYIILGQLIEKVTGMSYEAYVTENIIHKLGLLPNDLGFEIPDPVFHAKGYQKKLGLMNFLLGFFIDKSKYMGKAEGQWKPFRPFYVNGTPYGGLIGTARGFAACLQDLLKTESKLLSANSKQIMFTENRTLNGSRTGMCLGWFTGNLDGVTYFTHAGGGGGYYCEIRIYPEIEIGSVIFFNRTGMSDVRYLDKPDQIYFKAIK